MYFDGSNPREMHNYYAYLHKKMVYDLLVRKRGREEGDLFLGLRFSLIALAMRLHGK